MGPVVLLLHGGGYVAGDCLNYAHFAEQISRFTHVRLLMVNYQLAPYEAGQYPGLEDALAAYLWLTDEQKIHPSRIALTGDSAGAGLCQNLLIRLRAMRRRMPSCVFLN